MIKKNCNNTNSLFQISCFSVLLLLISSSVSAKIDSEVLRDETLLSDRLKYNKALIVYQNKRYRQFSRISEQLKDYPLYPYLKYKELRRNISKKTIPAIKHYLQANDNSPISDKLRTRTLKYLSRHGQWKDYLQIYKAQEYASLECLYLKALYKEGFKEPAFMQVPKLWMVSKSQHKSCNFIFSKFKKSGLLTKDMVWNRIRLAMKKRKIHLARYLAKELAVSERKWVSLWIRSHYRPMRLMNEKLLNDTHPQIYTIITHAIKRQARKNPDKAIELMSYLSKKTGIPYQNKIEIYKKIGVTLAKKHNEEAIHWLNKIPDIETTDYINEWKIQYAIRHEQWNIVVNQVDKMRVEQQKKLRWQFWWGYAHKQLGNEIESVEILNRVAKKRDYYGFLAADLTNQSYHFEDSPIQIDPKVLAEISAMPGVLRARELYHFKQIANARREWNYAIKDFSDEYLLTAAKIAYGWGWHDRAIAAIGKSSDLNDVEIRFPLVYKDIIDRYSSKREIDSAWTYAIIRRESIFINDAKSEKGALGLMQLLPRTARATARAIKTRYRGKRQLIKTKLNIRLGTHYLKSLFRKHNQQTVLATAAYNAGPSNVRRWLPANKPMDAIRWIESIPFKETREYVTNVLAYKIIYQFRMGLKQQSQLRQLMPPVPAKI